MMRPLRITVPAKSNIGLKDSIIADIAGFKPPHFYFINMIVMESLVPWKSLEEIKSYAH
ncbi:hypothetical protein [Cytobacillus firmus]|uniref:hypothetical protein n=1 Tax=Cytobacillus firmus TaxID=1399 RepID=UPI00203B2FBD|nr:hypothetical protein [Cytobacillus firmus]